MCSPEAPDERLLVEITAGAASLVFQLEESAQVLAAVMPKCFSDPKRALALARTLEAVVGLSTSLTRRIESSLQVASALRAQRRIHRGAAR